MRIERLINDTWQIIDEDNTVVLQGTYDDCLKYMSDRFRQKIVNDPKLLGVFKRLHDK